METDACCPALLIPPLPPTPSSSPNSTFPRELSAGCTFHAGCVRPRKSKTSNPLYDSPRSQPFSRVYFPHGLEEVRPTSRRRPGLSVRTMAWAAQKCCVHFSERDEAAILLVPLTRCVSFPNSRPNEIKTESKWLLGHSFALAHVAFLLLLLFLTDILVLQAFPLSLLCPPLQ